MRDDLDAPYAGAASALCPACGQPKGQGYGCAVLPEVPQDTHSVDSGVATVPDAITIVRNALAQHADDPCECGPDHGAPSCVACYDRAALALMASLEGAIALATEVLQHVNQWATFGSEGERFPWIAVRTAEALAALEGR